MSGWQPVTRPPREPMSVLMYWAKAVWRDHRTMEPVEIPSLYAVRYSVCYWDGKTYRESFTNHEVFEFTEIGDPQKPTHWKPLDAPPEDQP